MSDEFRYNGAPQSSMPRRRFLAAAAAYAFTQVFRTQEAEAAASGEMPYRTLGATGERVSLLGLGGYHIGNPHDEQEGIRIIRKAIDSGVNFLDNCWDYHGGDSEVRMGKALLDGYRKKVFLMTKIDGRDKKTAAAQINESLRRLQTDTIDLMQVHEVIRDSDPDIVLGPGGAMEALLAAKAAGKIRYIGFTGHKSPSVHLKMLELALHQKVPLAAVQMPLNVMDAHYESFEKYVLPVLVKHNIGVLGMKPMGGGDILNSHAVNAVECLHYAMSLPTSVVITGCDSMAILDQALHAARTFRPLTAEERSSLLARTRAVAATGRFEGYKTGPHFDGTTSHPEWLG